MNEYCTCGAKLPEDARFCHKCGKPQYDDPAFQMVETPPPVPVLAEPVAPAPPPGISFQNRIAVRVGFLAAALVAMLISFPLPPPFAYMWGLVLLLAGGFFSVWLYGRQTGQALTVGSGARMGWITGVFCFTIMMVFFSLSLLAITSNGGLSAAFHEALSAGGTPELTEQVDAVLQNRPALAMTLLFIVLFCFIAMTLTSAVGGALGAKVLEKE